MSAEKKKIGEKIVLVFEKALEFCGIILAHNCFTRGRLIRTQYLNND